MSSGTSPALVPFLSHSLLGIAHSTVAGPLTREAEYLLNSAGPSLLPSVEELLRLYYSGWFSFRGRPRTDFAAIAIKHGADFAPGRRHSVEGEDRRRMWDGILDLHQPRYPEALLRHLWRYAAAKGDGNEARFELLLREKLRAAGFPDAAAQDWYLNEREALAIAELIRLYALGLMDHVTLVQEMGVHGLSSEDIGRLELSRLYTPSPRDLIEAATGHNWNRAFAGRWGLDLGKPDEWDTWSRRMGLDCPADTGKYGHDVISPADAAAAQDAGPQTDKDGKPPTWGDMLWRAHWQTPTLGELAKFLHRFRGDPMDPRTWSVPSVNPYTINDVLPFMDRIGIPDGLKNSYLNLMYDTVSIRHMRLMIANGTTSPAEVSGWLKDAGQRPDNAARIAATLFQTEQAKALKPIQAQRAKALAKLQSSIEVAYETGTLNQTVAMAELAANGMDSAAAATTLAAIDVRVSTRLADTIIKRARSDVFAGLLPIKQVGPRLIAAGIAVDRVTQLIATWTAQLSMGRRTLGTQQILRYLRKGFIRRDQAMVRLSNLGWSGTDQLLLLHDVQAQIAADAAKVIATAESEKQREEHVIQRTFGRMESQAKSLIQRLHTLTPPAKVVKWYKAGLWSEDRARARLGLLGYTDDVIDTMLLEAIVTPKPAKQPKAGG